MNLKAEITVDELLKAMKLCACVPECSWCAYYDPKKLHKDKCYERRNRDFEYYISNLQDTNEALINGQETFQKALAERLAEVDDLKKHLATLELCEKSNDELRSALKKKDDELKAVRHYYNECLKDLKKAHAEIQRLKKTLNTDIVFLGRTGKCQKETKLIRLRVEAIRAEAFKDCAKVFVGIAQRVHKDTDDEVLIVKRSTLDCFVKGLTGDTE